MLIVSISMFPDIKSLSKKQRENYMIMDDQYFSFDASSNFLVLYNVHMRVRTLVLLFRNHM